MTAFLLMVADEIAVWAFFWTYRRSDVLVLVRIYWQSSWSLGRSCRRNGRTCWASCAIVCRLGPYQAAIDAICLFDGRICRRRIAIWFVCTPAPVFGSVGLNR